MITFIDFKKFAENGKFPVPMFPAEKKADIEHDDTEAPEEKTLVAAGIREGMACHIIYKNSKGETSARRISINAFKTDNLFYAFCFERNAVRSFRIDRIQELTDMDTGEILEDPEKIKDYLTNLDYMNNSPTKKIIREHRHAINVLMFLSRCDGKSKACERDVITHYIMDKNFFEDINGKELDSYLKCLYPSKIVFFASLENLEKKDALHTLFPYAVQLIEADGIITQEEHEWVEKVS